MQDNSQTKYQDYLLTPYWRSVSDAVKARARFRCQVCNSPHDLQAHHRTYEHRGSEMEWLDDLICLCRRCHAVFHGHAEVAAYVGVARARQVEQRPQPETVLITRENCKRLRSTKEPWHWMMENGINPRLKGWQKRAVGHRVPLSWLKGNFEGYSFRRE